MEAPASLSLGQLAELRRVFRFRDSGIQAFSVVLIDHGIFLWIESFCPEIVPDGCAGATGYGSGTGITDRTGWHGRFRHVGRTAG